MGLRESNSFLSSFKFCFMMFKIASLHLPHASPAEVIFETSSKVLAPLLTASIISFSLIEKQ